MVLIKIYKIEGFLIFVNNHDSFLYNRSNPKNLTCIEWKFRVYKRSFNPRNQFTHTNEVDPQMNTLYTQFNFVTNYFFRRRSGSMSRSMRYKQTTTLSLLCFAVNKTVCSEYSEYMLKKSIKYFCIATEAALTNHFIAQFLSSTCIIFHRAILTT